MMPLADHLDQASLENRLRTLVLTVFAASAVLLACVGIHGTFSYLARTQQREVGMRLALGALPHQIIARFLVEGVRVTLFRWAAGFVLSLGAGRLLKSMLYGVSALDAETYVGVLFMILIVATAASLVPAWRASSVEPVRVLREQ